MGNRDLSNVRPQVGVIIDPSMPELISRLTDRVCTQLIRDIRADRRVMNVDCKQVDMVVPGVAGRRTAAPLAIIGLKELNASVNSPDAAPITFTPRRITTVVGNLSYVAPQQHIVIELNANLAANEIGEELRRFEKFFGFLAPGSVAIKIDDALKGFAGAGALGGALPC